MNYTMHFSSILCPNFIFFINSLSISHHFSLTCRYQKLIDFANNIRLDFEMVIYVGEFSNDEGIEDDDLPSDLLRLVA